LSSVAKNWGVHAKLIYKYQILSLDRIMIVPWRHLVNDSQQTKTSKIVEGSILCYYYMIIVVCKEINSTK